MWATNFVISDSAASDELTGENTHIARRALSVDWEEKADTY